MIKVKTVYFPAVFYHKGCANLQTLEEHQGACEKTFLFLGTKELQTWEDASSSQPIPPPGTKETTGENISIYEYF